jgi:hypothetical protein
MYKLPQHPLSLLYLHEPFPGDDFKQWRFFSFTASGPLFTASHKNSTVLIVKVKVTLRRTISQSVSKSWCRAPFGAHDQIFFTDWQLRSRFCGVHLSDDRAGLSFVYAAGPWQSSYSQVRVAWYSRVYFTLSDLKLPFSSPPTTRRVTVEVFDPASTRVVLIPPTVLVIISRQGPRKKRCSSIVSFASTVVGTCLPSYCRETVAARTIENTVLLLLRAYMVWAVPGNDRCL